MSILKQKKPKNKDVGTFQLKTRTTRKYSPSYFQRKSEISLYLLTHYLDQELKMFYLKQHC
jgi:hypothetical protein